MNTQVYIFPQPSWVETVSCDGKPCGSGGSSSCGCESDPKEKGNCTPASCGDTSSCQFNETIEWLTDKYKDSVEVKVADYSSVDKLFEALNDLNRIFETNGEELRVTLDNIELVFSQISPIIAINNSLAFVGKTPLPEDLQESIKLYNPVGL